MLPFHGTRRWDATTICCDFGRKSENCSLIIPTCKSLGYFTNYILPYTNVPLGQTAEKRPVLYMHTVQLYSMCKINRLSVKLLIKTITTINIKQATISRCSIVAWLPAVTHAPCHPLSLCMQPVCACLPSAPTACSRTCRPTLARRSSVYVRDFPDTVHIIN